MLAWALNLGFAGGTQASDWNPITDPGTTYAANTDPGSDWVANTDPGTDWTE